MLGSSDCYQDRQNEIEHAVTLRIGIQFIASFRVTVCRLGPPASTWTQSLQLQDLGVHFQPTPIIELSITPLSYMIQITATAPIAALPNTLGRLAIIPGPEDEDLELFTVPWPVATIPVVGADVVVVCRRSLLVLCQAVLLSLRGGVVESGKVVTVSRGMPAWPAAAREANVEVRNRVI